MKALLCLLAIAPLAGCVPDPTVIGTKCKLDGDCNIMGQRCVAEICTRVCTGEYGDSGCPIGYDCSIRDGAIGLTCNKVPYAVDPMTGTPLLIGKDCSLDDSACSGGQCRKAANPVKNPPEPLVDDPNAYCTTTCTTNDECPSNFECVTDYDAMKKCLRRAFCSECRHNDNCPAAFPHCVATKDGTARYCTKSCNGQAQQCGGFNGTFMDCVAGQDAAGQGGAYCLHRFGACVGAGDICDPCRTKEDCAKSQGGCVTNDLTGERFCSKKCTNDSVCGGGTVDAVCDTGAYGICNGLVNSPSSPTLTCWPD